MIWDHSVIDRVDYPDYAHKLAKKVKINNNHAGILSLWLWHGYEYYRK